MFSGSLLYVETVDRPGLLVDLVQIITEINIAVESGEFDTEVLTLTKRIYHSNCCWKSYVYDYSFVFLSFIGFTCESKVSRQLPKQSHQQASSIGSHKIFIF